MKQDKMFATSHQPKKKLKISDRLAITGWLLVPLCIISYTIYMSTGDKKTLTSGSNVGGYSSRGDVSIPDVVLSPAPTWDQSSSVESVAGEPLVVSAPQKKHVTKPKVKPAVYHSQPVPTKEHDQHHDPTPTDPAPQPQPEPTPDPPIEIPTPQPEPEPTPTPEPDPVPEILPVQILLN